MFIQVTTSSSTVRLLNTKHIVDVREHSGGSYITFSNGEYLQVKESIEQMGYKLECPIIPNELLD
jgi:uncharacterized protein YlzI (FlbEa/FlbD family)